MKELTLYRMRENEYGTFGLLCDDKTVWVPTLERRWVDNQANVSCIPTGQYICVRHHSEHFGECFLVKDVLNRSDILFHAGNWQSDSKGCIMIGLSFEIKNRQEALGYSGLGFRRFMEKLNGENEFKLNILDLSKAQNIWTGA